MSRPPRLNVVVTVGMGPWAFDRLIGALGEVCAEHDVYVQTGTSRLRPPCAHDAFVPYGELQARLDRADVVITHAGNTVRLVQRMGKVPIAVARRQAWHEMSDDHQVEYLRDEEARGRVRAVWDVADLAQAVREHVGRWEGGLPAGELAAPADPIALADELDRLWDLLTRNPFRDHPTRRYAYAWEAIVSSGGAMPHVDVGCGTGDFLAAVARDTGRPCSGVDVHPGYVERARADHPGLDVRHVSLGAPLPYADATVGSVSLLDVLEHCPDEEALLSEIHRVLVAGGLLVLTVPARHAFSFLDPDNAKFRFPRLHQAVYSARFGAETYRARFVDLSDGLVGDIAAGRGVHTNYRVDELRDRLARHGFEVVDSSGANLFWRLVHGPALVAGPRLRRALERAILFDGRIFDRANLFLALRKVEQT